MSCAAERNGAAPIRIWIGTRRRNAAANAVLAENSKLLVIVESPQYSTDFTAFAALPVVLKLEHRVVYSPHAYSFSGLVFQSYDQLRQAYDARAGYLLHTEPGVPLWVGEFGACQTLDCGDNAQWLRWFVQYLQEHDLSWCWWPLNATQSSGRTRIYDAVETYGLLSPDYQHIGAPKVVELLKTIENPKQ